MDKYTLLGGHSKKELPDYFKTHLYFKYQDKEEEDTLFKEFQIMINSRFSDEKRNEEDGRSFPL